MKYDNIFAHKTNEVYGFYNNMFVRDNNFFRRWKVTITVYYQNIIMTIISYTVVNVYRYVAINISIHLLYIATNKYINS